MKPRLNIKRVMRGLGAIEICVACIGCAKKTARPRIDFRFHRSTARRFIRRRTVWWYFHDAPIIRRNGGRPSRLLSTSFASRTGRQPARRGSRGARGNDEEAPDAGAPSHRRMLSRTSPRAPGLPPAEAQRETTTLFCRYFGRPAN